MPEETAFPQIPITAAEIIRQVGHSTYSRGQKYMREGKVARYRYSDETRALEGIVNGNAIDPYSTTVTFPQENVTGSLAFSSQCSCYVYTDCKHAVALMLTAIDRADKARRALTVSSSTWMPSEDSTYTRDQLNVIRWAQQQGLNTASQLARADSKLPAWRRELSSSLAAGPRADNNRLERFPGALDIQLKVAPTYSLGSAHRNRRSATAPILEARPLRMGSRGKWIKGGLTWEHFLQDHSIGIHSSYNLLPEHVRWFTEFYSAVRPWQSLYTSHRDWVALTPVRSSLLWRLLQRAEEIDLPILLNTRQAKIHLAETARLALNAIPLSRQATDKGNSAGEDIETWFQLSTILTSENTDLWAKDLHPLGTPPSGFYALGGRAQQTYEEEVGRVRRDNPLPSALDNLCSPDISETEDNSPAWADPEADIVFFPLAEPVDPVAESLIKSGDIEIPPQDTESFLNDFYPQLARSLPVLSTDPNLVLPAIYQPELVITVTFDENQPHRATVDWVWEYPSDPLNPAAKTVQFPINQILSAREELRDPTFENETLRRIRAAQPSMPVAHHTTEGWETRALIEDTLPRLQELPQVRVDTIGSVPEYRELHDTPEITVSVDPTGDRDWFGLGIAIKVGQWYVPFAKIFEALNANKTHLLLGDGSYFALDRPEFRKLQELLREANALTDEKTGPLKISRHQAGMWEELEELATKVETVEAWDRQVSALLNVESGPAPQPPATLTAQLRPYQLEGFQWLSFLQEHELGGILADDMGLGKTIQTIAMIAHAKEVASQSRHSLTTTESAAAVSLPGSFAPFLVVAPTSVVPNWEREIKRFAPSLKVAAVYGTQKKNKQPLAESVAGADVIVTSYSLFRLDDGAYRALATDQPYSGLILDEAQFVKNAKTKAHRAARDLPARFKLAVTGTPMENNLMELWSLFSMVAPGLFPSARAFKDTFATPIENGEDAQALPRLRRRVRPLLKRRTKDLVAADLPEKNDMRVDVPLAPAHQRAYDTVLQRERKKVLGLLEDMDKHRFTVFQSLTTLRRMALDASLIDEDLYSSVTSSKLDYLQENLPEIIADGHRALVFSQFTSYLKKVADRLDSLGIDYLYLDGSTRDRATVLADFEAGAAPVFLISLKAGGFGLNLTGADYCFIMDPWWNPAAEQQAVDRVHRIGQTKNVMVYRLVSAGTIEEKVMDLKESKAALFEAVVDEGQLFSSKLDAAQIRDLLAAGSKAQR